MPGSPACLFACPAYSYDTETALRLLNADGLVDDVAGKRERVRQLQAELQEWEASGGYGGSKPTAEGMKHESFEEPHSVTMEERRLRAEVLQLQVELRDSARRARTLEQQRSNSLRLQLRHERERVEQLSESLGLNHAHRQDGQAERQGDSLHSTLSSIDELLTADQSSAHPVGNSGEADKPASARLSDPCICRGVL